MQLISELLKVMIIYKKQNKKPRFEELNIWVKLVFPSTIMGSL